MQITIWGEDTLTTWARGRGDLGSRVGALCRTGPSSPRDHFYTGPLYRMGKLQLFRNYFWNLETINIISPAQRLFFL